MASKKHSRGSARSRPHPAQRKVLPDEVVAEIVRRYTVDHASKTALAGEHGVGHGVIDRILREHGVTVRGVRDCYRPPAKQQSPEVMQRAGDALRDINAPYVAAVFDLPPVNPLDTRPKYVQVAHNIRHAIATGRFRQGQQLPSVPQMSRYWGVGVDTVMAALKTLTSEGLVRPVRSVGTFVCGMPVDRRS